MSDLQDSSSRVEALLALAQYEAAMGQQKEALRIVHVAAEQAKAAGDFGEQLRVALVAADLNPNPRDRLQALEEVKQRAADRGAGLIVSQALDRISHPSQEGRQALRSSRISLDLH